MKRMLVIDDEPDVGEFIAEVAQGCGYACDCVTTVDDFKSRLDDGVTLLVIDLVLQGSDGIELLRYLGERGCTAGIVLISGFDRRVLSVGEQLGRELGLRVLGHLMKPIRVVELEGFLARLAEGDAPVAAAPPLQRVKPSGDELRRAIAADQFVLHYQPQVEIRARIPIGFECLVRWNHPAHGLIYPDDFIGLAESLGLIDELTWLIASRAFAERKQFSRYGWSPALSINVSALSLRDLQMPDKLVALAAAAGISPGDIVIEVTESGVIRELRSALDILTRLRLRGLHLSIDDFGTGYSMLQQLKRIPSDELKIDKSFVQTMERDEDAWAVVRKTIELGHELGMKVVAEGVETEEQLLRLDGMNCNIAQGYYFSRPMPIADAVKWMERFHAMHPA